MLCWLPSVAAWARVVRQFTRPGGTFYIRDGHPLAHTLDLDRSDGQLVMVDPYFEGEAIRYDEPGTYTEAAVEIDHTTTYEWNHSLGEIVSALADEGYHIESLREYPFSGYQAQPGMVRGRRRMVAAAGPRTAFAHALRAESHAAARRPAGAVTVACVRQRSSIPVRIRQDFR